MLHSTIELAQIGLQESAALLAGSIDHLGIMIGERRIRLSATDYFFNKENLAPYRNGRKGLSQDWAYAGEFEEKDWVLSELVAHITEGKTFSIGVYRNNHRKEGNFVSSQLIGIEIDKGFYSTANLASDEFIKMHACLIYATSSSTPERPRSRILFILDKLITDRTIYRDLVARLQRRLSNFDVDPVCKDAARLFHGSKTDDFLVFPDNILPVDLIATFLFPAEQAASGADLDIEHDKRFLSSRFADYVNEIKTKLTELRPELAKGEHVRCPNPDHDDEHPSFRISFERDEVWPYPSLAESKNVR